MTKRTNTIATLLAAALLGVSAAGTAVASPWGGGGKQACAHQSDKRGDMHRAFKHLDLTEAQRDQLFEIRHAQRPAMREKMKELRKTRQTLRELATAETYDAEQVRKAAEQQASVQADLIVMRTEAKQKMMQLLTPEQKQKLAEKRQRHGHHSKQQ